MTPIAFAIKYGPEVVKFISGLFKSGKKRREEREEADFVDAVHDGDIDEINAGLHK